MLWMIQNHLPSKEEFVQHTWLESERSPTFTGYWPVWELEEDQTTKRLALSPQDVKDYALNRVYKQKQPLEAITMLQKYKIACCMAAGARRSVDLWLLKAEEQDDLPFAATLGQFGANPNRYIKKQYTNRFQEMNGEGPHGIGHRIEEVTLQLPLFFVAQSRKMAKWLDILNVDYTLRGDRDNGTVIHHLCTYMPHYVRTPQEALKLLIFYIKKGVDPFALDNARRTALHCVGENVALYDADFAIPLALRLYLVGIPKLQHNIPDYRRMTFLDYVSARRFDPELAGKVRYLLYAYMHHLVDDNEFISYTVAKELDCERVRDRLYEPLKEMSMHCECHKEERAKVEQPDFATARELLKQCMPLVPRECPNMACDQLRADTCYAHWWRLEEVLAHLDGLYGRLEERLEEGQEEEIKSVWQGMMNYELQQIFLDWHRIRALSALAVITNTPGFSNAERERALLEDDVQLVQHGLRHGRTVENKFAARSITMARLLHTYQPVTELDYGGNTPFHYLAQHGALCEKGLAAFYKELAIVPHAPNKEGITPLDILAQNSYRFYGEEEKLIALLQAMDVDKDAILRENPTTKMSPLDIAHRVHGLWQLRCTELFLQVMQAKIEDGK